MATSWAGFFGLILWENFHIEFVAIEYVRLCGYKNGEIGNGRKKECQVGTATLYWSNRLEFKKVYKGGF